MVAAPFDGCGRAWLNVAFRFFRCGNITLFAPQYPAGVTMHIHINKIGGDSPSTIQNINILNHYVGMKYIEPESIPELKFFPYIIGAMGVLGAIAIIINRKWGYLAWGILLILLSIAGFYDFYLWLYEYGHNLSPDAPIKVPGATYQPPLIGTKTILNFHCCFSAKHRRLARRSRSRFVRCWQDISNHESQLAMRNALLLISLIAMIASCAPEPREIDYGLELCSFCKMTVVDKGYAAEAVTSKGKVHVFDAAECMIHYMDKNPDYTFTYQLVSQYGYPGVLGGCTYELLPDQRKHAQPDGRQPHRVCIPSGCATDARQKRWRRLRLACCTGGDLT